MSSWQSSQLRRFTSLRLSCRACGTCSGCIQYRVKLWRTLMPIALSLLIAMEMFKIAWRLSANRPSSDAPLGAVIQDLTPSPLLPPGRCASCRVRRQWRRIRRLRSVRCRAGNRVRRHRVVRVIVGMPRAARAAGQPAEHIALALAETTDAAGSLYCTRDRPRAVARRPAAPPGRSRCSCSPPGVPARGRAPGGCDRTPVESQPCSLVLAPADFEATARLAP